MYQEVYFHGEPKRRGGGGEGGVQCGSLAQRPQSFYACYGPADNNGTNVEDLVKLIQEFPSRLKTINNGLGGFIKVYFYCVLQEWSI